MRRDQHFCRLRRITVWRAPSWLVEEGGYPQNLSARLYGAVSAAAWNLVAQSLWRTVATLFSRRWLGVAVSRIRQPARQREGIGQRSYCLRACMQAAQLSSSVSSLAIRRSRGVWQRCGFENWYGMGNHREASSGCYIGDGVIAAFERSRENGWRSRKLAFAPRWIS